MIAIPVLLAASPMFAVPCTQAEFSRVWTRGYGAPSQEILKAVAADGSGGAIVCGHTSGSLSGPNAGFLDATIRRVNAEGDDVWALQIGTPNSDVAEGVAVDDLGHIFVVGYTSGTLGASSFGGFDGFAACYDLQGNLLWITQSGSAGSDIPRSVIPDGLGGCVVAGTTSGDFGGPNAGEDDFFVAHIDGSGVVGEVTQLGTADLEGSPQLVTDGAGGYYLSGTTWGALAGPLEGNHDIFLGRYDGSDAEVWATQLGTPARDAGFSLEPDGVGGVFVCGRTEGSLVGAGSGQSDRVVGHYDGTGAQTFLVQTAAPGNATALDLAWDAASDRLFVVGTWDFDPAAPDDGYLAIYDASGTLLAEPHFGGAGRDVTWGVALNGLGGVYLAGWTEGDFAGPNQGGRDQFVARFEEVVGTSVCPSAVPNSTGLPARLQVSGSLLAANSNLHLSVDQLPPAATCLFLTSQTPGLTIMPGGSQGTLCLGGAIGRYVGPGQVQTSSGGGTAVLLLDLMQMPTPTGFLTAMPGQSWYFQAWHRDANPTVTSNFSDAVVVTFQ